MTAFLAVLLVLAAPMIWLVGFVVFMAATVGAMMLYDYVTKGRR